MGSCLWFLEVFGVSFEVIEVSVPGGVLNKNIILVIIIDNDDDNNNVIMMIMIH